jgi:uncharacterized protein (DUF1800 family)
VAHLYRRAAFGARPEELAAAVALGYDGAVEALLDRSGPDAADAVPVPEVTVSDDTAQTVEERRRRAEQRRSGRTDITIWWLNRMVVTDRPFREKLTWFWHDHFATSIEKVAEPRLMLDQNRLLREQGAGGFEALVQAVAKDPAMLVWLDSNQNRAGRPNENFARELMELFTIGIGNYTDADVQQAARAFTGWRVDRGVGFRFVPALADRGAKTVLGVPVRTGEELITLLVRRPEAARHVAFRAWNFFAHPVHPSDPVVAELGAFFAADLDVTNLMRNVFRHPRFGDGTSRQNLVKEPVSWMVGLLRAVGVRPDQLTVTGPQPINTLRSLNQEPFAPPSVGGWPNNNAWLSTTSATNRVQFAAGVAANARLDWLEGQPAAARPDALAARLGVDGWTATTRAALRRAPNPRTQLTLAAVSPDYVLA